MDKSTSLYEWEQDLLKEQVEQEEPQEIKLEPLFIEELVEQHEKENQKRLLQNVESSNLSEKIVENAKTSDWQPGEVTDDLLLKNDTYYIPSPTGKVLEDRLILGQSMNQQEQQEYSQGHARWKAVVEKMNSIEPEANTATLQQLLEQLTADQEEASPSFQAIKTTFQVFMEDMSVEKIDEAEINSIEHYNLYIEHYQNAVEAANAYLKSHKGYRWTKKGKRRKGLVAGIANALAERERHIFTLQAALESYEEKSEERESLFDTVDRDVLSIEEIQRIAVSGSGEERFRALYQLVCHKNALEMGAQGERKDWEFKENSNLDLLVKQLAIGVQDAPLKEQLIYLKQLFALDVAATQSANAEVVSAFREAPINVDGEAYAISKVMYSSTFFKWFGLQKLKEQLAGTLMNAYNQQFSEFYQDAVGEQSTLLQQLSEKNVQTEYMEKLPQERQQELLTLRAEQKNQQFVMLETARTISPEYFELVNLSYQDFLDATAGAGGDMEEVKSQLQSFMMKSYFDANHVEEYKEAYKVCIATMERYVKKYEEVSKSEQETEWLEAVQSMLERLSDRGFLQANVLAREVVEQSIVEQIQQNNLTEEQRQKLDRRDRFKAHMKEVNDRWKLNYQVVDGVAIVKATPAEAVLSQAGLRDRAATRGDLVRGIFMNRTGKNLLSNLTEKDKEQLEEIRKEVEGILSTDQNTLQNGTKLITEMAKGLLNNRDVFLQAMQNPNDAVEQTVEIGMLVDMLKNYGQITAEGKNGNVGDLVLTGLSADELLELEDMSNYADLYCRTFSVQSALYDDENFDAYVVGKGVFDDKMKYQEKAIELFYESEGEVLKNIASSKHENGRFCFPKEAKTAYTYWYSVVQYSSMMTFDEACKNAAKMNQTVEDAKSNKWTNAAEKWKEQEQYLKDKEQLDEKWKFGQIEVKETPNTGRLTQAGVTGRVGTRQAMATLIYMQRTEKNLQSEMTNEDYVGLEKAYSDVADMLLNHNTEEEVIPLLVDMVRGLLQNRDVLLQKIETEDDVLRVAPQMARLNYFTKDVDQILYDNHIAEQVKQQLSDAEVKELEDFLFFSETVGSAFRQLEKNYIDKSYKAYNLKPSDYEGEDIQMLDKAVERFFKEEETFVHSLQKCRAEDGRFQMNILPNNAYEYWKNITIMRETPEVLEMAKGFNKDLNERKLRNGEAV